MKVWPVQLQVRVASLELQQLWLNIGSDAQSVHSKFQSEFTVNVMHSECDAQTYTSFATRKTCNSRKTKTYSRVKHEKCLYTMKFTTVLLVWLLGLALNLSCMALKNGAEENLHIPGDQQLYEETGHYIDPNDMLADLSVHREAFKKKSSDVLKSKEELRLDAWECKAVQAELSACTARQEVLQQELRSKDATNVKILQQLATQGTVDYELHYRRFLSLLLHAVRSESGAIEEDGSLRRPLTFVLAEDVLTGLDRCVQGGTHSGEHVRQCDELLTVLFQAVEVRDEDGSVISLGWSREWPLNFIQSLGALLKLLGLVLIALVVWGSMLLLRDFSRNRRWTPFLLLLFSIIVVFCCLWNWRNMIKEEEAQRAADLEREGLGGSPDECRAVGLWAWFTGAHNKCTKYYAEVFIPATEKITLEQVVVRTLTSLLLSPLRALGREIGHFFNEFYSSMSVLYVIPASIMLVLVLALLLFFCCSGGGYTRRCEHSDAAMDSLVYQMRRENQKLMLESRAMMNDIGVALQASAHHTQPLFDSSCRRIEQQLGALITARFQALTEHEAPSDSTPLQQCDRNSAALRVRVPQKESTCMSAADHTDGVHSSVTEGSNSALPASESDFVKKVMTVVNESFSKNQVVEEGLEAQNEGNSNDTTVRRRATRTSTPLSPSSEKFLAEVRKALES
ncbi:Chloride channel CLIC-like [Trinorchestia longiramus]|nr:Chloride channel CLIC-like [Trinorchestia longiramus]